jgi:integrase
VDGQAEGPPREPPADLDLPRAEFRLPKHVMTATDAETVIATPDVGDLLGLRDRAILESLYATGMRRAEVTGLSVYDIDHERGDGADHERQGGQGAHHRPSASGPSRGSRNASTPFDPDSGDALLLTQVGDPFTPHGLTERVRGIVRKSGIPNPSTTGRSLFFRVGGVLRAAGSSWPTRPSSACQWSSASLAHVARVGVCLSRMPFMWPGTYSRAHAG